MKILILTYFDVVGGPKILFKAPEEFNSENLDIKNIAGGNTPIRSGGEYYKFAKDIIWVSAAQLFASVILGIVALPILTK